MHIFKNHTKQAGVGVSPAVTNCETSLVVPLFDLLYMAIWGLLSTLRGKLVFTTFIKSQNLCGFINKINGVHKRLRTNCTTHCLARLCCWSAVFIGHDYMILNFLTSWTEQATSWTCLCMSILCPLVWPVSDHLKILGMMPSKRV